VIVGSRMMDLARACIAALALDVALANVIALAADVTPPTPRGIAGSRTITHTGQPLIARVEQSPSTRLLVRVTDTTPALGPDAPHTYRIDYIGLVAGEFDLRTLITHADGSPASTLEPIAVTIVSTLPERHGTDLFGNPDRPDFLASHYRTIALTLGAVWLAVPTVMLVRRWIRTRPAPPPPPPPSAPTLADQIRPLAEAAIARTLSVEEQARLELLLFAFWRARRAIDGMPPDGALASLRTDPEASPLILALEGWIHAREGTRTATLDELLAPYAAHAAIPLEEARA